MIITYSPQRSDAPLSYRFSGEIITAELNGQSDVFDLRLLPDGASAEIGSTLTPCPVLSARREGGVLKVALRSHHAADATDAGRFPAEEII